MDFRFTDEEEGFRTEVKAFLKTELPKNWEEQFDSESELSLVASGDFAKGFQKKLEERKLLTRQQMDELRQKYSVELQEAHRKVRQEPQPKGDTIYENVFLDRDKVREGK